MFDKIGDPEVTSKVAVAAASIPAASYVVPMWGGATLAAFGMAALGAFMSYAWTPPEKSRRMLIFKSMSVTLFSVALVVVMPDLMDIHIRPESQPPMAFIIATFGRSIMPALKKAAPAIASGIAAMFGRGASGYDGGYPNQDYDDEVHDDLSEDLHRKKRKRNSTNEPPGGY